MQTQIIAHRGASADAPENTLAAFELAYRQGAQMIEFDVRPTADGAIVVFHDDTTARWNGRSDAVAALTLAAMQQIDLRGERAPTLDEVCDWARATGMLLNVEIKVAGIEAAVARTIQAHGIDEQVIISSFALGALQTMRIVAPDLARGVLTDADATPPGAASLWPLEPLRSLEARAWHPSRQLPQLEQLIPPIREAGYAVNVWTVDDPAVMRQLLGLRVEGIMTNRPALLAEVMRAWQAEAQSP
ncbi:MAG TPA: glycerophosphodiester phosphodiesterase family protein [Herpetosiphonaceae bacterium]